MPLCPTATVANTTSFIGTASVAVTVIVDSFKVDNFVT